MKILIQNGSILQRKKLVRKDLLIEDNTIILIDDEIEDEGYHVIDATGKFVSPGLIDMHVHLREPGFEHKETIETGTMAGARGGYT